MPEIMTPVTPWCGRASTAHRRADRTGGHQAEDWLTAEQRQDAISSPRSPGRICTGACDMEAWIQGPENGIYYERKTGDGMAFHRANRILRDDGQGVRIHCVCSNRLARRPARRSISRRAPIGLRMRVTPGLLNLMAHACHEWAGTPAQQLNTCGGYDSRPFNNGHGDIPIPSRPCVHGASIFCRKPSGIRISPTDLVAAPSVMPRNRIEPKQREQIHRALRRPDATRALLLVLMVSGSPNKIIRRVGVSQRNQRFKFKGQRRPPPIVGYQSAGGCSRTESGPPAVQGGFYFRTVGYHLAVR